MVFLVVVSLLLGFVARLVRGLVLVVLVEWGLRVLNGLAGFALALA